LIFLLITKQALTPEIPPYGVPLMRSCEFVCKVLSTIQNSTMRVWERFGDPSFAITYKTGKKDGADHEKRTKTIKEEFRQALEAKSKGQSADFIRAIDKNSEISIEVIGADNQILEMEVPARHILEQIVAKTGLPPWMRGLHWSTTERLSNAETEMLLADVVTRQSAKMPLFTHLVSTLLKLRGRTWNKGAWWLEWAGVNLHDLVAQADMYYLTNAAEAGIELNINDLAIGKSIKTNEDGILKKKKCSCDAQQGSKVSDHKELSRTFPWPDLDRVESDYENRLKTDWKELENRIKVIAGIELPKAMKDSDPLNLGVQQRAQILDALKS